MPKPNRFKVLSSQIEQQEASVPEEKKVQERADRAALDLILDDKGLPEQDIANAIAVLTNDPAFRGVFLIFPIIDRRAPRRDGFAGRRRRTRGVIDREKSAANRPVRAVVPDPVQGAPDGEHD